MTLPSSLLLPPSGQPLELNVPFTKATEFCFNILRDQDDNGYTLADCCRCAFELARWKIAVEAEGYVPVMCFPDHNYVEMPAIVMHAGKIPAVSHAMGVMPARIWAEFNPISPKVIAFSLIQWFLARAQEMASEALNDASITLNFAAC